MASNPDIVAALDKVGRTLQEKAGDDPINYRELVEGVVRECGCKRHSVLPTDHCYNRTNDGIRLNNRPMFLHISLGRYTYLGLDFPYSGPIFHQPKGQEDRKVGEWLAGRPRLFASSDK